MRTRSFFLLQATKYNPHSPYSASKASSDHFVRAFHDTYGMPTIVTNCSNNFREVAQPMLKNDYGRYLLSILDEGSQTLKKNDVKAIVNCAAWTNVDACETDEKLAALAEKLNADAPENLAKAMKEVDLHTHLIWLMPSSPYWIR